MSNQGRAYIFGIMTVFLWSTVATAFKLSLKYLDPIQLLLYSSLISVLTIGVIIIFQRKTALIFSFSKKQYFYLLGLGFLNPFLYYMVLFKAYDLLPAQEAQPLNYTWALTLTFLSIFLLGQKISVKDAVTGITGYLGVLIISTHGDILGLNFSDPFGVGLALGSTIIWAVYWIYNQKTGVDPVVGLFMSFLFSLPFTLVFCTIFSSIVNAKVPGLLGAAYVGVFEMGIAFVCWLYALKLSSNTAKISYLIYFAPFLSLIFIHFFLGEKILPSTLLGLVIITLSLLLQQMKFGKKQR